MLCNLSERNRTVNSRLGQSIKPESLNGSLNQLEFSWKWLLDEGNSLIWQFGFFFFLNDSNFLYVLCLRVAAQDPNDLTDTCLPGWCPESLLRSLSAPQRNDLLKVAGVTKKSRKSFMGLDRGSGVCTWGRCALTNAWARWAALACTWLWL